MITANSFTHKHNSFWKTHFPALDNYVRVINSGAYERLDDEQNWSVLAARNFLIAEVGFVLSQWTRIDRDCLDRAFADATLRLADLPGVENVLAPLNEEEQQTCARLAQRLRSMISLNTTPQQDVIFAPQFSGCGVISKSFGDYVVGDNLIEVKTVDRGFRATDFRQVLTYFFLNNVDKKYPIKRISIVNPRKGISFSEDIGRFMYDTSGSDVLELQSRFLAAVSMGGISR